jgi:F0F1-type ATP synthase assembly protein I
LRELPRAASDCGKGAMSQNRNPMAVAARYLSLATMLPAATFVGYLIGYLLDKAFGTRFLYLVFLLLGIAAGFIELIRQILKDTQKQNGT